MNSYIRILFGLLLLASCSVASEVLPIESYPGELLSPVTDSIAQATVPQLRTMVERSQFTEQEKAAKALLEKTDEPTVARLAYAFRRGNQFAEQLLLESASLQMIPYLLEDVAHGSLENYGTGERSGARVRLAATAIMTAALARQTSLPPETVAWFANLERNYSNHLKYIPEHSKALIDWWTHNGEAVLAGRMEDADWLPVERNLVPKTFEDWRKTNEAKPSPPPPLPPPTESMTALPLQVAESFEDWSKRVIDSDQRDVTWAMVDFETGKSVQSTAQGKPQHNIPPNEFNRLNSTSLDKTGPVDSDDPIRSIHRFIWVLIIIAAIVTLWQTIKYFTQKLNP